ncbi:MAG: hypothetical protein AAFP04_13920 [Myxococcota bacterium]
MRVTFRNVGGWSACAFALIVGISGCSSDSDPTDVTPGNDNDDDPAELSDGNDGQTPPAPYDQVSWSCEDVQADDPSNPAGVQGRLLQDGAGTLYYAFLKRAEPEVACDIAAFGGGPASAPRYDLFIATRSPGGGSFDLEEVDLVSDTAAPGFVSDPFGIGAALNGAGQPVLSVAAGGSGLFTCGSADLVVATRTGSNAYNVATRADASSNFATVCDDDEDEAGEVECCVQGSACGSGTNVGPWSDVAINDGGQTAVVFTDFHNFADEDGQSFQGVELWESSGGVSGVRPWSGLGRYAAAQFAGDGSLVVAFTGYQGGGMFVVRRSGGERFVGVNGSARGDLFPGFRIGERIDMAVAPDGTLGIVFHAIADRIGTEVEDLWYCESDDNGATINTGIDCTIVERESFLKVGGFPSLAYDSQSRPAISYNYCGPDNACSRDGLRYAWRDGTGKWWYFNVHNVDNNRSGQYTSLVIDPTTDAPTIAFHDQTRGAAMIATGAFDGGGSGPCAVQ